MNAHAYITHVFIRIHMCIVYAYVFICVWWCMIAYTIHIWMHMRMCIMTHIWIHMHILHMYSYVFKCVSHMHMYSMCIVMQSCVWSVFSICVKCFFYLCEVSFLFVWSVCSICVMYSYVCCDAIMHVKWRGHVWRVFICVSCFSLMCVSWCNHVWM